MRLYGLMEFLDCVSRNLQIFVISLIQFPGLDPEQPGEYQYPRGQFRIYCYGAILFALVFPALYPSLWLWSMLILILSPAFACMFFELVPDEPGQKRIFSGPRVWLSRWYVAVLGLVVLFSGLPAWVRWSLLIYWIIASYRISACYSSPLRFYETVRSQNPRRDPYRITALGLLFLISGRISDAEDECLQVQKEYPDSFKNNLLIAVMQQNIKTMNAGWYSLTFQCSPCEVREGTMVKDGARLTHTEHDMYFLRTCPKCGQHREPCDV